MDMVLPFLYLSSLLWSLFLAFPYLLTASLMAYIRNFESLNLTKAKDFILAPIYAWIHLFFLLPITIYAMFTTNRIGWGTR